MNSKQEINEQVKKSLAQIKDIQTFSNMFGEELTEKAISMLEFYTGERLPRINEAVITVQFGEQYFLDTVKNIHISDFGYNVELHSGNYVKPMDYRPGIGTYFADTCPSKYISVAQ